MITCGPAACNVSAFTLSFDRLVSKTPAVSWVVASRTRSGLMRALILEQRYDCGDYLNCVKLVVLSLMDLASEIVFGIPAAAKNSSQYRLALAPIQDRFRLYDLPPDRPANRFKMITRLAKITSQAI